MCFNLPNIFNLMYIQQRREIFPLPSKNSVAVYNQVTPLIIYYISSRVVILLKVTGATIQVSNIPVLTICFKEVNFTSSVYYVTFQKQIVK